jgi:NitT/TauT family transport system substrate-binding protein
MEPNLPDVWVASQETMEKKPEVVKKTLAAFYEALDYMRHNRPWALEFIKKLTNEQNEKVVELSYEQGTLKQSTDGHITSAWVQNGLDLGIAGGMSALKGVDPNSLFTTEFLPSK